MKSYIQYRPDLATDVAVETECAAYPENYTPGTLILAANGDLVVVIDTAGDTKLVTVSDPA